MDSEHLKILKRPRFRRSRLVLGVSGWMDGGEVSTGTVRHFIERLEPEKLARIESEDFYLYSFPGSMEVSALFRPHVRIEQGRITEYEEPHNDFFYHADSDLLLFLGKEPQLRWEEYADCMLNFAAWAKVEIVYFIGSVGGLVPHTREPRVFGSVSDAALLPLLEQADTTLTDYEGPAGISSYLTHRASAAGIAMLTLVAEIPAYVQGRVPRCIGAVARRLAGLLDLRMDFEALRKESESHEKRLDQIIRDRPELALQIRQLEDNYDKETLDYEMGDLKAWLQQQGINLD